MSLSVANINSNIPRVQDNAFGSLYPTHKKEKLVDSGLSRSERTGVAVSSGLGVAAALAILAKTATWKHFSLNPKKIMNTRIKDTYLYQAKFEEKEIITMAAGSIAGGLAGGLIIDDRSNNNKAEVKSKVGEAIIQLGNACVPILTVGLGARTGDKIEKKILATNTGKGYDKALKWFAKLPKISMIFAGLAVGMVLGNISANYLKKELLDSNEHRKIKPADMFMHWDDLCVAASFLSDGPVVQGFARLVPLAMLMAGYQVGCKGLEHQYLQPRPHKHAEKGEAPEKITNQPQEKNSVESSKPNMNTDKESVVSDSVKENITDKELEKINN